MSPARVADAWSLKGHVVIITGAAQGQGAAEAEYLATLGAGPSYWPTCGMKPAAKPRTRLPREGGTRLMSISTFPMSRRGSAVSAL